MGDLHAGQDGYRERRRLAPAAQAVRPRDRFMMYEPDERTTTIEAQTEVLKDILATDNMILLAEENGRCVGFLEAAPSGATGMSPAWWSGS
jgi:hypothetical protein